MTGWPARTVLRGLLAGVVTLVLTATGAGAALAHDAVVVTSPAPGAELSAAPSAVEIELSSPPQALGTEVRVTDQNGVVVSEGEAQVRGNTVRQPLTDDLGAGAYAVEWRVTSGDGHPISGSSGFAVAEATAAPPAAGSAASSAASSAAPPADSSPAADGGEASAVAPAGSSSSVVLVVGGALVVLVVAGLVVRRLRRHA